MTQEENIKDPKAMAKAHETYRDIWEHGLENYPFARSRIVPIIYEIHDGAKVLDVGCNSGEFIKYLKEKKGCDVYGVDISGQLIEKCKEKGLENTFHCDADKLPFDKETFDVVTLMETLEHFDDPKACLKEIRRVLKPNGYLLGTCPHANLERYVWSDDRLHHQYYDEDGIMKDLRAYFDRVFLRTLTGAQFNLGFASSFLATEPAEFLFKCGGYGTNGWDELSRTSNKTKVYWAFTQLGGVIYYRMAGFIEKMDKMGIESAHEVVKYNLEEKQGFWQNKLHSSFVTDDLNALIKESHLSVWQVMSTKRGVPLLMAAKELHKKPIVMEVDDWLFDLPSYNIASHPYKPNSDYEWMAYKQVEVSDYVICSTQFIKDGLLSLFPDKRIYVIPNSIDFGIWDKLEDKGLYPKQEGKIRIGFTGCGNHNGDLELIKRPLKKILEDYPNVEFITYGIFDALKDVPHISTGRWVPIDKYPNEIKQWNMDIGIAPLRDNNFNRAKSNLRWLEYSALKVPTIASKVYPFENSIKDGVTGKLVGSSELSWYEAMKELILDEEKRRSIGENAYNAVKTFYNMDIIAGDYASVLKEIRWNGVKSKARSGDFLGTPSMTVGTQQV